MRSLRLASAFLFVLTVEGVEVWTFPSDKLPVARGRAENWLDERAFGGMGPPLFSPPDPSPRPCLLHVQQLEVRGFGLGVFALSELAAAHRTACALLA